MSDSFARPWIVALQAPLSMGLPRQGYWSGLPFPSPDNLCLGIEPASPVSQGDSSLLSYLGSPIATSGYWKESKCWTRHPLQIPALPLIPVFSISLHVLSSQSTLVSWIEILLYPNTALRLLSPVHPILETWITPALSSLKSFSSSL